MSDAQQPSKEDQPILPIMLKSLSSKEVKDALQTPIYFTDEQEFSAEDGKKVLQLLDASVRPPPTGAEHLIAQELALAIVSIPVEKIRHICEAFMVLDDDEVIEMGMKEAFPIIKRVHALSQAFQHTREDFDYDEYSNPREMIKVGFPFTESEAYDYLHPWATRLPFESYLTEGRLASLQLQESITYLNRIVNEAIILQRETGVIDTEIFTQIDKFKAKYLYWCFRDGLTYESYNAFYTAFIAEYTPKAMKWFKKIMSKVSPSSFKEALTAFGGKLKI